jgi:hypothetical protein
MRLLLNRQGFQAELLAPDPAHDGSSHTDASFIRQIDSQGTRLPNLQENIAREFPPAQRNVPDSALSLEQASVVRDEAVHREALVETKREGHERLAGKYIVVDWRRKAQEASGKISDTQEEIVGRWWILGS